MAISIDPETGLKIFATRAGKASEKTGVSQLAWALIDGRRACERSYEYGIRSYQSHAVDNFMACKKLCESQDECHAIDWFRVTSWCSLYKRPCSTPLQMKHGSSSYRLIHRVKVNKFSALTTGKST